MPERDLAELTDLVEEMGLDPSDLDAVVHDVAGRIASRVNNNGLEVQVAYLVDAFGRQGARSAIEGCRRDLLDDLADLRGIMADGYTSETINSVLARVTAASGRVVVCVWDYHDAFVI